MSSDILHTMSRSSLSYTHSNPSPDPSHVGEEEVTVSPSMLRLMENFDNPAPAASSLKQHTHRLHHPHGHIQNHGPQTQSRGGEDVDLDDLVIQDHELAVRNNMQQDANLCDKYMSSTNSTAAGLADLPPSPPVSRSSTTLGDHEGHSPAAGAAARGYPMHGRGNRAATISGGAPASCVGVATASKISTAGMMRTASSDNARDSVPKTTVATVPRIPTMAPSAPAASATSLVSAQSTSQAPATAPATSHPSFRGIKAPERNMCALAGFPPVSAKDKAAIAATYDVKIVVEESEASTMGAGTSSAVCKSVDRSAAAARGKGRAHMVGYKMP